MENVRRFRPNGLSFLYEGLRGVDETKARNCKEIFLTIFSYILQSHFSYCCKAFKELNERVIHIELKKAISFPCANNYFPEEIASYNRSPSLNIIKNIWREVFCQLGDIFRHTGLENYENNVKFLQALYSTYEDEYGIKVLSHKKLLEGIEFYGKHADHNLERCWKGLGEKGIVGAIQKVFFSLHLEHCENVTSSNMLKKIEEAIAVIKQCSRERIYYFSFVIEREEKEDFLNHLKRILVANEVNGYKIEQPFTRGRCVKVLLYKRLTNLQTADEMRKVIYCPENENILKRVRYLAFSYYENSGFYMLPRCIKKFSNVSDLDLGGNEPGSLESVKHFKLKRLIYHNAEELYLNKKIIAQWKGLKELDLYNQKEDAELPEDMLKELQKLEVCKLNYHHPFIQDRQGRLKKLEGTEDYEDYFSIFLVEFPKEIYHLPNLKILQISQYQKDTWEKELQRLKKKLSHIEIRVTGN